MSGLISKMTRGTVLRGYHWAKKNPGIRSFLYANQNASQFGDFCQHEWMLSCDVRVNTYHDAIQKHVQEGDVVVELGAGTGVLSLFASKKKPKRIYAIEHGDIIELARHIAAHNGVSNISFEHCHSADFVPEEKADVIIQEQIGDFLVDEDMIRNVCDLRDRVLAPGGKILPGRFELFVEPVCLAPEKQNTFIWDKKLHGFDFSCAREWIESDRNVLGRVNAVTHASRTEVSHFLCEPDSIFRFDLMTIQPNQVPKRFCAERVVTTPGMLDGYCIYFRVIFDDEIAFQTGPMDRLTAWMYQVYRADRPVFCQKGDRIALDFSMPTQTDFRTWTIRQELTPEKSHCPAA